MSKYLLILFLLVGCGQDSADTVTPELVETVDVEIVAHRGIGTTDNTIVSFTTALNLGFTSLETDLRMQGGEVVLAHDKTISNQEYLSLKDFLIFASNNDARVWLEAKETETIKSTLDLLKMHNLDVVFMSYRQGDIDLINSLSPSTITGLVITKASQIDSMVADWAVISRQLLTSNYEKIKHLKIGVWTITEQQQYDGVSHLIDAAIADIQLTQ